MVITFRNDNLLEVLLFVHILLHQFAPIWSFSREIMNSLCFVCCTVDPGLVNTFML